MSEGVRLGLDMKIAPIEERENFFILEEQICSIPKSKSPGDSSLIYSPRTLTFRDRTKMPYTNRKLVHCLLDSYCDSNSCTDPRVVTHTLGTIITTCAGADDKPRAEKACLLCRGAKEEKSVRIN